MYNAQTDCMLPCDPAGLGCCGIAAAAASCVNLTLTLNDEQTTPHLVLTPSYSTTLTRRSPETVREAIRLAVKLHNQQGGGQAGMLRAPVSAWGEVLAAPGATKGCGMAQRLQDLEGLVSRGVLSRMEADGLKVR
jgi:hypothetical protein